MAAAKIRRKEVSKKCWGKYFVTLVRILLKKPRAILCRVRDLSYTLTNCTKRISVL